MSGDDVRRLVLLCLTGVAFAILAGTSVVVAAMLGVAKLRVETAPGAVPSLTSPSALLLLAGTLGGILVAMVTTWRVLAPIGNWYRRGMLATVAAFATAVLMLLAMPAHSLFGTTGLLALLATCLLGALLSGRRVARLSR